MVYNFKANSFFRYVLAGLSVLVLFGVPALSDGSMLDELCRPNTDGAYEIVSLSEEAEATGMPSHILQRLLAKGYKNQAAAKELAELLCLIIRVEEEGFLPDLLFLKLEEGLAKNASLSGIKSAIQKKVDDMAFAQRLLSGKGKPKVEDINVTRIARAMSAGLPRRELRTVFSMKGDIPLDMRVTAAEVMAYGAAAGYDNRLLDQIVKTGLTHRSFHDEWSFFVKVIAKARKKNISDQRVADQAIQTLSQKGSLNDLISALGMKPADVY